jgi:hypothetical protein
VLTPDGQVTVADHMAKLRERAAAGVPVNPPPVPGARAFTLAQVDVGWSVFSTLRRWADTDDPLGGLVCEIVHDRGEDPETGEMWDRTRYSCLMTWVPSRPWVMLDANEIDLTTLSGIDRDGCWTAVKWLTRPVAQSRRRWPNPHDLDAIDLAWQLARALR